MFQVITRRDDNIGYHIYLSDIPYELSEDSIVFMPELSTKEQHHVKYVSKYTHKSGNIIVKLVRSDGTDPFGRPKSLSHSLVITPEEYNFNSLKLYSSPLIESSLFDSIDLEPGLLEQNNFVKSENKILEIIDSKILREIIVAAMIEPKVVLQPYLNAEDLVNLASLIDKAIPYEASYDFSLITYSDKSCNQFLIHNVLYFFSEDKKHKGKEVINFKNISSKTKQIAKNEKEYLDKYIEMILSEDYENLLQEHAKWVIGMNYEEHKELQRHFTRRYQLDIPFSRRNKFHAQLVKSLSIFYT
jgi:hypothetical protein